MQKCREMQEVGRRLLLAVDDIDDQVTDDDDAAAHHPGHAVVVDDVWLPGDRCRDQVHSDLQICEPNTVEH